MEETNVTMTTEEMQGEPAAKDSSIHESPAALSFPS